MYSLEGGGVSNKLLCNKEKTIIKGEHKQQEGITKGNMSDGQTRDKVFITKTYSGTT